MQSQATTLMSVPGSGNPVPSADSKSTTERIDGTFYMDCDLQNERGDRSFANLTAGAADKEADLLRIVEEAQAPAAQRANRESREAAGEAPQQSRNSANPLSPDPLVQTEFVDTLFRGFPEDFRERIEPTLQSAAIKHRSSWEQALAAFIRKESSIDGTQESIIDSSEGTPEEELDNESQYVDGEAMEGRQPGEWSRFLGPSEICRAICASKKCCKALLDIRQHIGDLTPTSSRIALSTWDDTLDSPTRRAMPRVSGFGTCRRAPT